MKKCYKIIFIVLGVFVGIFVVDTLQAILFNSSPLFKIRENFSDDSTNYVDKGLLVNHYYCLNKEGKTVFKGTKYSCSLNDYDLIEDGVDKEVLQCLENELGGYLVSEKDDLVDIPIHEIKKSGGEEIAYYKGVYASEHPDNRYVVVYPKNGTYDYYVMRDFDKYFYEKYPVYQNRYISSIMVYVHNSNNNVNFDDIVNKCVTSKNFSNGKPIPSKTIRKLSNTKRLIIKSGKKELGIIEDEDTLADVLNALSSAEQDGDFFLCDGNGFSFEMYDSDNQLIDTVSVWGDGKRLIPESIHRGCSYYSVSNDIDLRKVIEEHTDYVFYNIFDFRDRDDDQILQLLYNDNNYDYFLKGKNNDNVLIGFLISNQTMRLQYALENKYISAFKVSEDYPDLLIRK